MGDDELLRIITSALEMRDQGFQPPIESLCGARTDLIEQVSDALGLAGDLPELQRDAAGRDQWVGRILGGRYRLNSRLGAGAMGVVYRGEDIELNREVAVKVLRSDMLAVNEAELRFAREAESMAAVDHPSVVTIYDRGTTKGGELYLVMELLEGRPLGEILEEGHRRDMSGEAESTDWIARILGAESIADESYLRTAVRWVADLASGLSAAHAAGVIHRDVKPSNVFVRRDERPVLLDFGIAARSSQATFLRQGAALGTPAYMAPEALDPEAAAGPSRDVYSLTATLYHILILRAPYSGSPSQVISELSRRDPVPAYQLRPGLPRDLQAILDRGMARRSSERYASAAELEADLRAFLDFRPVKARPISVPGRVWRRLRRSTAFFVGAGVAVLALSFAVGSKLLAYQREVRRDNYLDVIEHLPPSLAIGSTASRYYTNPREREALEGLLDKAVEYSEEALPSQLIRAAFRFDQGETQGAAEDMEAIAASIDSPYTRDLARRYSGLGTEGAESNELDLEDLPEPEVAMDFYVAAFHCMRSGQYAQARILLEDERLDGFVPAQALLIPLIELANRSLPAKERGLQSLRNYERAVRLEEQLGIRTATTAHLLGSALLAQERYEEAVDPLRDGVELTPWSYGLHLNLGIAARRIGRQDEAETHLRKAIALRPSTLSPHTTLARLFISFDDLGSAQKVVDEAPFSDSSRDRRTRLSLEGDIEMARALVHRRNGQAALSLEAASRSIEKFTQAGSTGSVLDTPEFRISQAIVSDNTDLIFTPVAEMLVDEPLRWRRLATLLEWMPSDLTAEQTNALRSYLHALKDVLAHEH